MGRAPCCDKANVKKGPWSPEEDAKLKDYIENSGTGGNWIALPQKIGLRRCGKSCRLRWLNYLRPNIKHGGFSEEEDNIICNLYVTIGSRWSIIAAQLPGRTDNDIKNYWNTRLKKKLLNKQRKEFQEARMKQEMVTMKRQQQGQGQCNGSSDLYLNNMFGSSPWPLLPQLPQHHQVPLVMNHVAVEPTSCSYYQTTPSCNLEKKPLVTLKNMVKLEEEPERTNPDHHHQQDSITNPFDFSFSQLLLDPNYYLGSGGGEGDFAIMSSSTNSPLPNTSGDHYQNQQQEILQWFGNSNFQSTEAINDMFLNNNNIVNLETNENTKFYGDSSVAGAGAALAGGTTSTSADQSTISWEDITSLVNSEDASYFNGPNHL